MCYWDLHRILMKIIVCSLVIGFVLLVAVHLVTNGQIYEIVFDCGWFFGLLFPLIIMLIDCICFELMDCPYNEE